MHSISQQPHSAADRHNGYGSHGSDGSDGDDDSHDAPLSGPHDYETRVQSYLQSLKAYIENASIRRKWVAGVDEDERKSDDDRESN